MLGIRALPTNPLVPIDGRIFRQFVQDYTDSVLLAPSPEVRSAAQASLSKCLRPEVLWMFRHAWQTTRNPFSTMVTSALRSTIKQAESRYTDLTKTLFDQFFASETTEIRYESVLDLKDLFPSIITGLTSIIKEKNYGLAFFWKDDDHGFYCRPKGRDPYHFRNSIRQFANS
jgi:hypothetical protein